MIAAFNDLRFTWCRFAQYSRLSRGYGFAEVESMGFLSGLLSDIRKAKREFSELEQQVKEGTNHMAESAKEVKKILGEIHTDLDELDGDMQELLDKIAALGDAPTAEEMADILATATAIKARTRSAADKVPEASPTT